MALDSYTALQTAIATWLIRDDLSALAPDFITLAEAQINRDVRHWRQIVYDTEFDVSTRYVSLPLDWLETIRLTVAANERPLELASVDAIHEMRASSDDIVGVPAFYAHLGEQFEIYPTPSEAYSGELIYYAQVPNLADNGSNWLLTTAPDVYLYGSLLQTAPLLKEDERITTWASLYSAAVQRLNQSSAAAMTSGTSLRVRPPR